VEQELADDETIREIDFPAGSVFDTAVDGETSSDIF
jgi:hypothetical protein